MPYNIPASTLIATKMASGAVQLVWYDVTGGVRWAAVIPNASFTALNTTVNGGSTGATLTQVYAQDASQGDYPQGYTPEN